MIHISPWEATEGLVRNAATFLPMDGPLFLYGPFMEDGVTTAPSNLDFNESLKARDPSWGIRSVADLDGLAASRGLTRTARHDMPANNLMLVYRR